MAYLNVLASASQRQVAAIQQDESAWSEPGLVVGVSHLLAYWVQVQPLGRLLGEALDGGQPLSDKLDHKFRPPVYHTPEQVRALERDLRGAWRDAQAGAPNAHDFDGFRDGIDKVLRLFAFASNRGDCVISYLDSTTVGDKPWPPPIFDPPPPESGSADRVESQTAFWGILGGAVALGVLGLCYWRYQRFAIKAGDRTSSQR